MPGTSELVERAIDEINRCGSLYEWCRRHYWVPCPQTPLTTRPLEHRASDGELGEWLDIIAQWLGQLVDYTKQKEAAYRKRGRDHRGAVRELKSEFEVVAYTALAAHLLVACHHEALKRCGVEADKVAELLELLDPSNGLNWHSNRAVHVPSKALNDLLKQVQAAREALAGQKPGPPTAHSLDFRSVRWYGETYFFTPTQAKCVKALWCAWEQGTPVIGQNSILNEAGSEQARLIDVFNGSDAWGTMITSQGKGAYRLTDPTDGDAADS